MYPFDVLGVQTPLIYVNEANQIGDTVSVNVVKDLELKFDILKGFGVYFNPKDSNSLGEIPGNTILFSYIGEYISTLETKRRQQLYDRIGINYILTIIEHLVSDNNTIILRSNIDATNYGNIARFMNHSCDANCVVIMCRNSRNNEDIVGIPLIMTKRVIHVNEELTFNYHNTNKSDVTQGQVVYHNYKENHLCNKRWKIQQSVMKPCYCNSSNCIGVLL